MPCVLPLACVCGLGRLNLERLFLSPFIRLKIVPRGRFMYSLFLRAYPRTILRLVIISFWVLSRAAYLDAQGIDPAPYVFVQKGNLPIIISAPHGGNDVITGVPARTGVGVSDFVTVRDGGTEELAYALATAIQQRFGKKPYVVASKASRLYVDLNRSAANAYEHPDAQAVYEYYHNTMKLYSRTVANKFHGGLVIDLHGQATSSTTVFRGTRNGATVRHLRSAYGQSAHDGPNSLFGLLVTRGWVVDPPVLSATENTNFNGGYIVGTYGSQLATAVDAMQFEFGSNYRGTSTQRSQTAADLTDALVTYARLYLRVRVPN